MKKTQGEDMSDTHAYDALVQQPACFQRPE